MGLFDSLGELFDICHEFRDDMQELFTDGFKEMVIDGNSDYQTSSDVRAEADEIISRADCSMEEKRSEAKRKFNEAEQLQEKVLKSRRNVLNDVKEIVKQKQVCQRDLRLNSDTAPHSQTLRSTMSVDLMESFGSGFGYGGASFSGIITGCVSPLGSLVSTISSVRARKNAANEYLSRAKDYEVKASHFCADVDTVLVRLRRHCNSMVEELAVHDMIKRTAKANTTFNLNEAYTLLNALNMIGVDAPEYSDKIIVLKGKVKL